MKETATDILLDDVVEGLFSRPCSNATCGRLEPPRRASAIGLVTRRLQKYEFIIFGAGFHERNGGKGNPGLGRTSNPLAAPEALGVSRGATIAVLLVVVSTTALDPVLFSIGAAAGAFTVSAGIGLVLVRGRARPERTLLGGLAVTMMAAAGVGVPAGMRDTGRLHSGGRWIKARLPGGTVTPLLERAVAWNSPSSSTSACRLPSSSS